MVHDKKGSDFFCFFFSNESSWLNAWNGYRKKRVNCTQENKKTRLLVMDGKENAKGIICFY